MNESLLLDDFEASDPHYSRVCTFCVHNTEYRGCKAFKYVPDAIWLSKDLSVHTKPFLGDHGVQFKHVDE